MRYSKKLQILFVALILIFVVSNVSFGQEKKKPLDKIRVAYNMYIDDLPFYVALEEGLWKKEGLDVELVRIESAADIVAATVRGDIQTGSLDQAAAFLAAKKGLPIKIYAWFGHTHKGTACGIHVDKAGDVKTIEDLKGKRITTSGNIQPDLMLKEALAQHNMTINDLKTIKGIRIDAAMQQEAALRSAGVDGTVTCDPVATMLEMHGASRRLASFNDIIPGWIFSGIFFNTNYVKDHPAEVKAFLRGVIQAYKYIKNNEAKARPWIAKYSHVDMDVAMKSALREFGDGGREPEAQLIKQRDLMIKYGYLDEKVPVDKVVDYSYLPK
jgi:NitT/TauT family transport system substrate-binding protein